MPENKKILVSVSKKTDDELKKFSIALGVSKSELVRTALSEFLNKLKKNELREALKKGYTDMADINLTLAEMYFEADEKDFSGYEEKLSESEKSEC